MIAGLTWKFFRHSSFGKELLAHFVLSNSQNQCLFPFIASDYHELLEGSHGHLVFGAAEDAKHALGPVPLCRNADGYFRG